MSESRIERKHLLFEKQKGCCHWCGGNMRLHAGFNADDLATFEHLHDSWSEGGRVNDEIVLSCRLCNYERNKRRVRQAIAGKPLSP